MANTKKPPTGGSNKKVANSLVTLSSAAVMAIYAAGYSRTRTAAAEIEMQSAAAARRPVAPAPAPADRPATEIADLTAAPVPSAQPEATPVPPASTLTEAVAATDPAPSKNDAPAPAVTAPAAEDSKPAVAASAPVAAAPAVVASAEPAAAAAPAPAPKPAAPAASQLPSVAKTPLVKYKDGTYRGWGRSAHGEILAFVNIQGGRIIRSGIDKCQTRWSCSLVEHLGPQVVARQSADVDFVAGATQSGNAFYYGVVGALEQAAQAALEAPVDTEGK